MAETTLALAGASTLAVSLVYGYVGYRLLPTAPATTPAARAMQAFSAWWIATSANQFLGSLFYLGAAFGYTDVALQMTYVYLQRLLLALSLVGLMYYLVYLQTGKSYLVPLTVLYSFYLATQLYVLSTRTPIAVESYHWRTDLVYAAPVSPAWELANLMIVVPPIVGALMMLRVFRRVDGPTRRFRIAMIGGGFVLWWLTAILAGQPQSWDVGWLQAANRVVGVAIAIGVLLAYEPMLWMQRRYGLEPFAKQTST